jgi:hypothetical protein
MKGITQFFAFIIGTTIVAIFRSSDGFITVGDILFGALVGGSIALSLVNALFKDNPAPIAQRNTVNPALPSTSQSPKTPEEVERQNAANLAERIKSEKKETQQQIDKINALFLLMTVLFSCPVMFALMIVLSMQGVPEIWVSLIFFGGMWVLYALSGWGINKNKSWGRKLGLVTSAVSLILFPVGTAFGIYMITSLQSKRVKDAMELQVAMTQGTVEQSGDLRYPNLSEGE